jgi:hypothetical protein
MPYFFILPAYVALFLALVVVAVIARFVPRLRIASGYIVAGAIGTLIGFLLVNIIVWLAGLSPVWLSQRFTFPPWLENASKFFVAVTLIIGPFIGSAIGVLAGFAAGFYFVYRRRRQVA